MNAKQLNLKNLWAFGLLAIGLTLANTPLYTITWPLQLLVTLFIVLYLAGANITYLIEKITRRHYDPWVSTSLSILSSLIALPPLVLLTYLHLEHMSWHLVLAIYLTPSLLPLTWPTVQTKISKWIPATPDNHKTIDSIKARLLIRHPVTLAIIALAAIHLINLSQYSFLPVPDSYSWLINFEGQLPHNKLPLDEAQERGAFSALVGAIFYLTNTDLFTLFKYLLPFISILTVLPLWLIAREIKPRAFQFTILASALISPTVILEFDFVRQQVIFLIFLYFVVGLQIYGLSRKDSSVFYLTGLYSLLGTLTHPAFLITTLTWIISFILAKLRFIWRHKYMAALVVLLGLPWAERIHILNMAKRIEEQANASFNAFTAKNWNLRFPSHFINSDGYEMSWPGLSGVAKYYGYYTGPLVLLIATLFIILLATSAAFRRTALRFVTSQYLLLITVPFILFFIIAELAPRFGNIAFLPDRAWQYLAIYLIAPLFFALKHLQSSSPRVLSSTSALFILAALISTAGAGYVNYLTKFTLPDYEFRAAAWMQTHLPHDSRVFSSSSKNIIRYHGQAEFVGFKDSFYSGGSTSDILSDMASRLDFPTPLANQLDKISARLSDITLTATSLKNDLDTAIQYNRVTNGTYDVIDNRLQTLNQATQDITSNTATSRRLHNEYQLGTSEVPPLYIYYARTHDSNPYASRPYQSSFTADLDVSSFPTLDGDLTTFERVYEDSDKVVIWRVKTDNIPQL